MNKTRIVRLVAASAMALATIGILAPAASAEPVQMHLCDLEQGPDGPQCVQKPTEVELCKLDENLKCAEPKTEVELCTLDVNWNCVEPDQDELQPTDDDPQPPVDPEPEGDPEPQVNPEPQTDTEHEPKGTGQGSVAKPAAANTRCRNRRPGEVAGIPEFDIAASPAMQQQPQTRSNAGLIGLAWWAPVCW